jgi:hypothetical protein
MTTPLPQSDFGYKPQYTSIDIGSLRDVDLLGLADGNVLVWNETRELWDVGSVAGANELNDMTDVVLTGPSTNEVLTFDGADWVNAVPTSGDLNSITDVTLAAPALNQVLTYNGANWANAAIPSISMSGLTDTTIAGIATNEILAWTGAAWANTDSPTFAALTVTTLAASTSITDGTVAISSGAIVGAQAVDATSLDVSGTGDFDGALTAGSVSDGVAVIDSGAITNVTTITADDVKLNVGEVTQITSTANPVTLNAGAGIITSYTSTLAADSQTRFTVTCDSCVAASLILANVVDYPSGATGVPTVHIDNIASGTFDIVITNVGAAALNDVYKIGFAIH